MHRRRLPIFALQVRTNSGAWSSSTQYRKFFLLDFSTCKVEVMVLGDFRQFSFCVVDGLPTTRSRQRTS
jgi:hypothetical protein